MRKPWILGMVGVLLLGPALSLSADPSYQGTTGLFFAPTADLLPDGGLSLGMFADAGDISNQNWYTVGYGINDTLEVGLLKWNWNDHDGEATAISAKMRVTALGESDTQIAVGINNITEESGGWVRVGGSYETQVYVVASHPLKTPQWVQRGGIPELQGHLGFIGGTPESNFFVGLELPFVQGFTVIAENYNEQNNLGARLGLGPHFTASLAFIDLNDTETILGATYKEGF